MNTPQPAGSRDLRTCRACGHVFSRVHGTCPSCGALRDHRRKHKRSQRVRDRIDRAWYACRQTVRRYKWYILYIGGGVLIAVVIHPTAMFLAEFSRPPGWRDARWEADWSLAHFFEPFIAAGETLWRWIAGAVASVVALAGKAISLLLRTSPSLLLAAMVGACLGAVLAWRRSRRRGRHRHRHERRRRDVASPVDAQPESPPTPMPGSALDDDWDRALMALERSQTGAASGPDAYRPRAHMPGDLDLDETSAADMPAARRPPPLDPGV